MERIKKLFDHNVLAVVENCGYPCGANSSVLTVLFVT